MKPILIVDDSATSRLLFRAHLPAGQFEVMEADSAEGALALVSQRVPELVVLDYNMPGANGVEIGYALRAAGISAPLTLLTANTQRSVVEAAGEAGFAAVVEKPITREKIADLLSYLPA